MGRVLLGVTGGIAAYKACELTRLLVRAGHEVTPILTPGAERFVTAQTFEALAGREMPRELLDAVRFLGNRSSGRMGAALAAEARRRGAEVTLVAANLSVPAPVGVDVVPAPTAESLARETLARAGADVVLMTAAVADYRPAEPEMGKRPKDGNPWTVTLEPTTDVLRELGERRANGQVLVGFAADASEQGLERARQKLAAKRADVIVFNDISREDIGFDAEENEVVLVAADGERRLEKAPKERIAAAILDEVAERLGAG